MAGLSSNTEGSRDILRTSLCATMDHLPISGVTLSIRLQRPPVTVPVWTVTRRRACARPTQDMVAGQDGHAGDLAASHVEEGSGRGHDLVLLLRKEVVRSHAVCVKEREKKRKHVTTTNAHFGVSGLLGRNAQLPVGREREPEPGLVMDLPSDSHMKGLLGESFLAQEHQRREKDVMQGHVQLGLSGHHGQAAHKPAGEGQGIE